MGKFSQIIFRSTSENPEEMHLTISFSEYLALSEPLFQKLNILNFEKLVIQRICLMMFKCSIGVLPLPVSAPFQYNSVIHTHNTGRSKFIHTPIRL